MRRNTTDVDMYFNILHKVGPGALKIALVKREHKKIQKEVYMYLTVFVLINNLFKFNKHIKQQMSWATVLTY